MAIWHSPLTRATATASAIGTALAVPLTPEPDLREIAQGDWEGRLVAEILASDGERLRTWRHSPVGHEAPGGEWLIDADVRAPARAGPHRCGADRGQPGDGRRRSAIEPPSSAMAERQPTRPWGLVVGHDGMLRVAMLALLGLPLERFWTFPFVPAGITVIEFHGGMTIIRAHDLDDHLAPLQAAGTADPAPPAGCARGRPLTRTDAIARSARRDRIVSASGAAAAGRRAPAA